LPRRPATPSTPLPAPPALRKATTARVRIPAARAPIAAKAPGAVRYRNLPADHAASQLVVYMLGASIAIHGVLLAIRFQPFDLRKMQDRAPPLEVALVNAKTKSKPTKADFLAQANLDGGGNTDANRQAKTPLPVLPRAGASGEIAVAAQKIEALETEAKQLMTRLKSAPTAPPVPKPVDVPEPAVQPSTNELMQRTLEAMRIEARIAKEMEIYQQRPKRRFVGGRAEEYRFARYVEDWRSKIERVGNLNYPEAARQLKLYGNLLLTVSIRSDGSVENVEINRSSGQKVLDAAAVKIVQMAAPYAAFPADIKRDTDVLHITRTWMFTKGDELRSE
jgi:protein TonB